MLITIIGLSVISVINAIVTFVVARNVSRLIEHEIARMDQDSKQWHSANVTYRDTFLANQELSSNDQNITNLM